ncbi:cache domain-containing protein [Coralliovum pocilloporae]|uniref:cache domain-containing protein n=1 Tax=Coralliovum pocilloporae TaxID=3066369 RepID=UPI00330765B6
MTFKTKLFLITLFPVLLVSGLMLWVITFQSTRLAQSQAQTVEAMVIALKREELKNYVTLARNALSPIYQSTLTPTRQAQRQAREIVRKMTFGEDSYFFIYDEEGKNIVNPRLTYLVGSSWIGLTDKDGRHVVKDLIDRARSGGEFYSFVWKKPSSGEYVEKLGYSVFFEKWGWMLGTGIYLDDVSKQVLPVQAELENNIRQTQLVLVVLSLGAILMTAMVIAVARFSEQKMADSRLKELAARLVDVQEQERKRVSRELHDGISQLLVSARYGLDLALDRAKGRGAVSDPISKSMTTLDNAISEVRRISMALRPSVLDDMGLAAAVKSLASEFSRQTGIDVDVDTERSRKLLSDEARTALYRVVQEALTNVARHSGADRVKIGLKVKRGYVDLTMEDNGVGLASEENRGAVSSGLGIRNMQERVESFGGRIRFSRTAGGGLAIHARLPIEQSMLAEINEA